MTKKDYCVIGAGRFGTSLIETLSKQGCSIMAVDSNRKKVNEIAPFVSFSSVLDSTNVGMLRDVGILEMDHVFVAIGSDIQTSIMTCASLIEIGVANITAKASSDRHEMVLKRLGIKDVVRPEKLTGRNTALRVINSTLTDVTFLSDKLSLLQVEVTNSKHYGISLKDMDLSNKNGTIISAIKRKNKIVWPSADIVLERGDVLVIVAQNSNIKSIESNFR